MWKVAVGFFAALGFVPLMSGQAPQPEWPMKWGVEAQPLIAQTNRIASAMEILGQPLDPKIARALKALRETQGNDAVAKAVQEALDPLCLAAVEVGPTGVTRVIPGRSVPLLVEQGWTLALVKVINQAGTTGILQPDSPSAKPIPRSPAADVENRWLGLLPHTGQPMLANLSGVGLEYTMVQLWSKNAETRSAEISFAIKGDKAKSGNAVAMARIGFQAKPSSVVTFRVTEFDGSPSMAGFTITDAQGRIFPSQAKRLAPDFFFQKQIYRADGETVRLPKGTYQVVCRRGPESIPETKTLVVGDGPAHLKYTVARWIDPSTTGWWSGDHHIHAAGCAHYDNPTEGVEPADMMRHILGEDLKIGCCLTWGPCFDYQKRFFTGRPDTVSKPPYILRYDVEVSGFGSQSSGHLNLLRLKEQIYPGGESKHHWPTLGMNTLRWAKKQGAVCGPAHSANGLTRFVRRVPDTTDGPGGLPNFHIPAYDGIGANELIVQDTHTLPGPDGKLVPACDFISTMDTDRVAEFNMWYHLLNCGSRIRASGETDFPCISGERVGMGRIYVKLHGPVDFDTWVQGLADGKSYVSDGTTHLMDPKLTVGETTLVLGEKGSELNLDKPQRAKVTFKAAAFQTGKTSVPVELVVNGYPVAKKDLVCDGKTREITLEADITKSSWIAVRVFPHAHTNPFFVLVNEKPIRANADSARWCQMGVEQCWMMKNPTYKKAELAQAEADYDHARKHYQKVLEETAK